MVVLYTANASSTNGRNGIAKTDDNTLNLQLSSPVTQPKPGHTNPEQLFACGYAACFGGAIDVASKQMGVTLKDAVVHSSVNLHKDDSGFYISVNLNVSCDSVDKTQLQAIVDAAHQICPYSKATRGNIDVKVGVI